MDLARAPRRTARKKGSGYENENDTKRFFNPVPLGNLSIRRRLFLSPPRKIGKVNYIAEGEGFFYEPEVNDASRAS